MEAWVGPAIIAAVISSLISVIGWFVSYRLSLNIEERRRREKIIDFQIALHAEIRSELHHLRSLDLDKNFARIKELYDSVPGYSVTVPHPVRHVVFETLIEQIQILPKEVIDPVILYNRQRYTVEKLVEDMRDRKFSSRLKDVQISMYGDYVKLRKFQLTLARRAVTALAASLAASGINIPAAGPSDRQSASAAKAGLQEGSS